MIYTSKTFKMLIGIVKVYASIAKNLSLKALKDPIHLTLRYSKYCF